MSRLIVLALLAVACSKEHPGSPTPTPKPALADAAGAPKPHEPAERHRESGGTCEKSPPGNPNPGNQGCKSDADCKEGPEGRCRARGGGHEPPMNRCGYDRCHADAECPNGGVCECDSDGDYCLEGDCRTDSDCGGFSCSPDIGCRGSMGGYHCHKAADTCVNDEDCQKGGDYSSTCGYQAPVGHWACEKRNCPVG